MRFPAGALAVAVCAVAIGISVYDAYLCQPISDEGYYSDGAYNLSHHGFLGTTFLESAGTPWTRLNQHTYFVLPLLMVGQAAWMKVFSDSLFSVRLFSICWMPISIAAWYLLSLRIGMSRTAALIVTFIYSTSFILMDIAKDARPEMMCQALGWSGLAAYAALRNSSLTAALVVSNFLVAASGLTHPNGVLYLAGLIVMVLYLDRSRLRWTNLAAAVGVYAVVGAAWGAYILQDPRAFHDQFFGEAGAHVPGAFLSNKVAWWSLPFRVVWDDIHERYLPLFGVFSPFPASRLKGLVLVAYVAALISALVIAPIRRAAPVKLLLFLLAAFFAVQCVFNAKFMAYFIHILPLYCALLGYVVWYFWENAPRSRVLLATGLVGLAVLQMGFVIGKARSFSRRDEFRDLRVFLKDHGGNARLIFADNSLLHELNFDPRFLDDRYFGVRSGKRADIIIQVLYLDGNIYGTLRQTQPGDWMKIQERLSEYKPVFERPGLRVLVDAKGPQSDAWAR